MSQQFHQSKVSHQHIGACALVLNSHGQVLWGKRKNSYKAGYYGLPGGHIELNEPVFQTIQREVLEETGIRLDTFEYVGVIRENQGEIDFIHFVFVAKNVTQEPLLMEPEKCEGWHWRYSTEINEMMLPGHIAAIKMYQQHMSIYDLTQQNIAKTE